MRKYFGNVKIYVMCPRECEVNLFENYTAIDAKNSPLYICVVANGIGR